MTTDEEKAGKLQAGMENLSEEGRAYIKTMADSLLVYQNSPDSSAALRQPVKTPPEAAERESLH
jgi:hypothetical protein